MITKTKIYDRVVQRTQRTDLTDIDDILLEALNEIASRTGKIRKTVSGTLTSTDIYEANSNVYSIDKPTDFITEKVVFYDKNVIDALPFNQVIAGCYGYCVTDSEIYFGGVDASKAYQIDYCAYHTDSLTTILFPDLYSAAIVYLCCKKVYEDYELDEKAEIQRQRYETEILMLPTEPIIVKTRRI